MKSVNLFTSNLTGKVLISEKSATKKAVCEVLKDYEKTIDSAFMQVTKSADKKARDCGNAAKGKYKTALEVVANCFPYQTKEGILCVKGTSEEGEKVWKEKKLTAAAARGIVRDSLKNFTNFVGQPEITVVVIGAKVEK